MRVKPLLQRKSHVPLVQTGVALAGGVHLLLQPPQLLTSVERLTHVALNSLSVGEQAV